MEKKKDFIKKFKNIAGDTNILTANWSKIPYSEGWRYGSGKALAVAKPGTRLEIWDILMINVSRLNLMKVHQIEGFLHDQKYLWFFLKS